MLWVFNRVGAGNVISKAWLGAMWRRAHFLPSLLGELQTAVKVVSAAPSQGWYWLQHDARLTVT